VTSAHLTSGPSKTQLAHLRRGDAYHLGASRNRSDGRRHSARGQGLHPAVLAVRLRVEVAQPQITDAGPVGTDGTCVDGPPASPYHATAQRAGTDLHQCVRLRDTHG
jgi:hypothetical protein